MFSATLWIIIAIFAGIFGLFWLVAQLLPDGKDPRDPRVLPLYASESDDAGHE